MSKIPTNKVSTERKYLREFVNSIINREYAMANASLAAAVKANVKAKVVTVLGRIHNEE